MDVFGLVDEFIILARNLTVLSAEPGLRNTVTLGQPYGAGWRVIPVKEQVLVAVIWELYKRENKIIGNVVAGGHILRE